MNSTILAWVLIALLFSGTGKNPKLFRQQELSATPAPSLASGTAHIKFSEIDWTDAGWRDRGFPLDPKYVKIPDDFQSIVTKEEAIEFGQALIGNRHGTRGNSSFFLHRVMHSPADNIWVLSIPQIHPVPMCRI